MTDEQVEQMRQWAITQMEWERAICKERGKKLTPIKGTRKMNTALKAILGNRDVTAQVRGKAAAEAITEFVTASYAA